MLQTSQEMNTPITPNSEARQSSVPASPDTETLDSVRASTHTHAYSVTEPEGGGAHDQVFKQKEEEGQEMAAGMPNSCELSVPVPYISMKTCNARYYL